MKKSILKIQFDVTSEEVKKSLEDYRGKKVVLYFYPKDATPGCTTQGLEFTQLSKKFKALNAVILGVSRDSIPSHKKFIDKQSFSFDLISDNEEKLCQAFDVIKDKNMYGKKVRGIERSTFIFDEEGQLLHEWRKVKAEGHAEVVLQWLKENS